MCNAWWCSAAGWLGISGALVLLLVAAPGRAPAAGFNIYEQGARATALGGAFTATADDGSALFYNPAGIAFNRRADGLGSGHLGELGPRTTLDCNLVPIFPDARFAGATPPTPGATGRTADQTFYIPGIYLTHGRGNGVTLGLGLYAPFGLGVEWRDPENWIGREMSYNVDLATVYLTPAVAYRYSDQLAFALGLDIARQSLTFNRFNNDEYGQWVGNVIDAEMTGTSAINVSSCAGVLARPLTWLDLGVMYHQGKTMRYRDAEARLRNVAPEQLAENVAEELAEMGGSFHLLNSRLHLPSILSLAVAVELPLELARRVRLEFDAVFFGWSANQQIALDFENPLMTDVLIRENYDDTWQLRLGLDVPVHRDLNLMFGAIDDQTPQPVETMSPLLPDSDRRCFTTGVAYHPGPWRVTASYMAVDFEGRSNVVRGQSVAAGEHNPVGAYSSFANILAVGVGRDF